MLNKSVKDVGINARKEIIAIKIGLLPIKRMIPIAPALLSLRRAKYDLMRLVISQYRNALRPISPSRWHKIALSRLHDLFCTASTSKCPLIFVP